VTGLPVADDRLVARLLQVWRRCGVTHADVALRRPSGSWWATRGLSLSRLPPSWAAAANARHADIFVRPARGGSAAFAFLDDLPLPVALRLIATTAGCAIFTSPAGGCQAWLILTTPIDESRRTALQRTLARHHGADPGSISGDHYGRLPGLRNWKRGGCLVTPRAVNLDAPPLDPDRWSDPAAHAPDSSDAAPHPRHATAHRPRIDHSAHEWGWVCGALEHGVPEDRIRHLLLLRAIPRRGHDAERYVDHTLRRARARTPR